MVANKITIVGAGIGGLTLANALEKRGIGFQLYEKAESFEALGYGIQISPNVVRVLQNLGLADKLKGISHLCRGFELRSFNSDRVLVAWQLNSELPYYQCRRADLHQLLFDSLQNKSRVHFGRWVTSYRETSDRVELKMKEENSIETEVLIAADGVGSAIRQQLFPESKSEYAGYSAFRAILPFEAKYNSLLGKATVWMGENHHVVAYPNGNLERGKVWINLVLVIKDKNWQDEGWTIPADKEEIARNFQNRSALLNEILKDLVADSEPCFKWGLCAREPLPYWSQGKVTLLGDSAHPMLPFQAQGAAMAIEDAAVLAKCLAGEKDRVAALKRYQEIRLGRTAKMQQVSRNNADIFHAAGIKATVRDFGFNLINAIAPSLMNLKSAWIYDFNPLEF